VVRRDKSSDLLTAEPMNLVDSLSDDEIQKIAHSHGNDSDNPGFRSYYNNSNLEDESLNNLVALGIMNRPYEASWGGSWYYTLSRLGCIVAKSLLPIKRCEYSSIMNERQKLLEMLNVTSLDFTNKFGVPLKLLKVNPSLTSQLEGQKVLIYSGEWGGYWRAGNAGYTELKSEAGVHNFEEAWKASSHCGDEKSIYYRVI